MTTIVTCVLAVLLALALGLALYAWRDKRHARILLAVAMRLNSTIKRNELLQLIMKTAADTLKADGSSIILVDEEKQELYFEVATGEKHEEVKEIRLKIGEGIAGWVAQSGQSLRIDDVTKDPRWSNRVSVKVQVPTRNMLCVPVISGGKTLGVLQVINRRGRSRFGERDLRMLEMIASPAAIALENMFLYEALLQSMETLRETTAAKERIESELKIAQSIQRNYLPGQAFRFGGSEVRACLRPAREVGGDFYHYLKLDDHRMLFCLGDVSDKGMPAALFMAGLMIWIRAKADNRMTPGEILTEINREISTDDSTMFATIFLGILDTRSGLLQYTEGGHCPPMLASRGGVRELETDKQLPIGIFPEGRYADRETFLTDGDTLVLYTDGITEAENPSGDWYGRANLVKTLEGHLGADPLALLEGLLSSVEQFAQHNPQSDDIAILAIRYAPSPIGSIRNPD